MTGKKVTFLYLSEPDMIKAGVLDMAKCVDVIEETFRLLGKGDYLMGGPRENEHGTMLWFPEEKRTANMPVAGPDRRFMAMIAYLGGKFNVCGEKWYGSNVENPRRGLPRSILTVMLNDPVTSEPLAVMSGNLISAMRTGAVPGVAAKYLAVKGAEVVGVIGGGVINKACLMAIAASVKTIRTVKVYDVAADKAQAYAADMSAQLGLAVRPASTLEEAVSGADVLSVATSGVAKAKIATKWLKEGALLTLTGTADLTDDCFLQNVVVADNWKMHMSWLVEGEEHPKGIESVFGWAPSGQLLKLVVEKRIKSETIINLGDIVSGKSPGRRSDKDRIVFVTGGMPVEDVAWGYTVYREAVKKGLGQELLLWDEPHWY